MLRLEARPAPSKAMSVPPFVIVSPGRMPLFVLLSSGVLTLSAPRLICASLQVVMPRKLRPQPRVACHALV